MIYVIYYWNTGTLGTIKCCESFVTNDEALFFISKLKMLGSFTFINIIKGENYVLV